MEIWPQHGVKWKEACLRIYICTFPYIYRCLLYRKFMYIYICIERSGMAKNINKYLWEVVAFTSCLKQLDIEFFQGSICYFYNNSLKGISILRENDMPHSSFIRRYVRFPPLLSNLIFPVSAITFCDKRINTAGRINEVSMSKDKGDEDY